jgi:hypothetical protein
MNNALFMRLDSFLERCHDILDLTQTIVQFSKLAKIEIGGTKGKTITDSVKEIHEDFQKIVAKFKVSAIQPYSDHSEAIYFYFFTTFKFKLLVHLL